MPRPAAARDQNKRTQAPLLVGNSALLAAEGSPQGRELLHQHRDPEKATEGEGGFLRLSRGFSDLGAWRQGFQAQRN